MGGINFAANEASQQTKEKRAFACCEGGYAKFHFQLSETRLKFRLLCSSQEASPGGRFIEPAVSLEVEMLSRRSNSTSARRCVSVPARSADAGMRENSILLRVSCPTQDQHRQFKS